MSLPEQIAQRIEVTVTPLDPTKCYFIVIRDPEWILNPQLLKLLNEQLHAKGIRAFIASMPESVTVECIEQEAPQERTGE